MDKKYLQDLYLLTGLPVPFQNVGSLYQHKLLDIAQMGEDDFHRFLSITVFEIEDLEIEIDTELEISTFDLVVGNCLQNTHFKTEAENALSFFFNERVRFNSEYGLFYIGEIDDMRIIHKENYELLKEALKQIYYLSKQEKKEGKPVSEAAKRILEKQKESRKQLDKIKGRGRKEVQLSDLISAFCANSNTSLKEVWNLTLYQFMDQFYRLQLVEDYDIKIRSVLAGADPKEVNPEHYVKKM